MISRTFLVIYNSELNFINSYAFPAEEMSPAMLHIILGKIA